MLERSTLTIRAERKAVDSRYAQITRVMRESEQHRPRIRRLGDQLGAIYTPLAAGLATAAWIWSGDPKRFLAVVVVATPCPLLIAIPVAIVGAISLAARRGIVIKDPAVLERIDTCRVVMFDKTGTLTYGRPKLTDLLIAPGFASADVLSALAGVERYSRHPLAAAILEAVKDAGVPLVDASEVSERPGEGLRGVIGGRVVHVTSRAAVLRDIPDAGTSLPAHAGGLECVVLIDGKYAATCRFRDEPRQEGAQFVRHLGPQHGVTRVLLVSGDRASEAQYLADVVGISEVHASQSPEDKLGLVRRETARATTLFLGDGINDAPALAAATVGVAFGQSSDVTAQAAGAVIMDSSLQRVDELMHIGRRMRRIALQSAIAGMAASGVAMVVAAGGALPPVAGAIVQELIDLVVVLNALRASAAPTVLTDYQ